MSSPRPQRPSRGPSGQAVFRRVAALVGLLVLLGLVVYFVAGLGRGSSTASPPATTATIRQPKPFRIVFPEGFSRVQMAVRVAVVAKIAERERHRPVRLSERAYLAVTGPRRIPGFGSQKRPLEGFLFPATYDFLRTTTAAQLVQAQLQAFQQNWHTLNLAYARSKNLTPYDVLIIASLVEKEAMAPSERGKIARVIYNRLRAGMNLGIDATTRYGLHVPPTQSLTESELASNNPYNTRNPDIKGLPPTPIANPGLASLRAAAHPTPGDWLYFVREPDKVHHYFTANYQDFLNYEAAHGYVPH